MAAFAKSSFNAQIYAASRPTYPQLLLDLVFRYHEAGSKFTRTGSANLTKMRNRGPPLQKFAVDLGCGTGQATIGLLPFERIVGVDPSKKMVQNARMYVADELKRQGKENLKDRFEFVVGSTEDLSFLGHGSVDLVIAAQAAHWFDWKKLWPELARVLRPNGTVAVWGYSEMRLTRYPSLTPLINAYTHGPDPRTSLGPHWQQPGRSIVENLLRDIPSPDSVVPDAFFAERRVYFSGPHFPSIPHARPVVLHKDMSWDDFEAYLRSFSSLNTFQTRYPEDADHPDGDIVQRFIKTLKAAMLEVDLSRGTDSTSHPEIGGLEGSQHDKVEIEWPLALILAKKD